MHIGHKSYIFLAVQLQLRLGIVDLGSWRSSRILVHWLLALHFVLILCLCLFLFLHLFLIPLLLL